VGDAELTSLKGSLNIIDLDGKEEIRRRDEKN